MTDGGLVGAQGTTGQAVDLQQMLGTALAAAEDAAKPQAGAESFEVEAQSKFMGGAGGGTPPQNDSSDVSILADAVVAGVASRRFGAAKFAVNSLLTAGSVHEDMKKGQTLFPGAVKNKAMGASSSVMPSDYWSRRKEAANQRKKVAKAFRKGGYKAAQQVRKKQIASDGVVGSVALTVQSVKSVTGASVQGSAAGFLAQAAAIQRRIELGAMAGVRHDAQRLTTAANRARRSGNDAVDNALADNPNNPVASRSVQQNMGAPKPPSPKTSKK